MSNAISVRAVVTTRDWPGGGRCPNQVPRKGFLIIMVSPPLSAKYIRTPHPGTRDATSGGPSNQILIPRSTAKTQYCRIWNPIGSTCPFLTARNYLSAMVLAVASKYRQPHPQQHRSQHHCQFHRTCRQGWLTTMSSIDTIPNETP